MGDNVFLGDRDGVRTPMQWSPDRNAGFSRADFAQLYSAPLMDPVYGYQALNVEGGVTRPVEPCCTGCSGCSRSASAIRCSASARFEVLSAENPSVLA